MTRKASCIKPEDSQRAKVGAYEELLHSLYDAITHPDGFTPFLEAFCDTFDCYTATLTHQNLVRRRVLGGWFANMPEASVKWYLSHLVGRDPLLDKALEQVQPGFCATNIHFPPDSPDLNQQRVNQWRDQSGCFDATSAVVMREGDRVCFLTLTRKQSGAPFSDDELVLFNRFLPHISRAVRLHQTVANNQSRQAPLVRALEQIKVPVLICNPHFQVIFSNQAACDWLDRNPWMRLDNGALEFTRTELYTEFFVRLVRVIRASVDSDDDTEEVMVIPPDTRGHHAGLSLTLSKLGGHESAIGVSMDGCGAMISLYPWDHRLAVRADELQRRFDLTPAEAQVCALLCQGLSLDDIAGHLSRELSTVRSHIKALYRKTGTSRQAELVAMVLSTAYRVLSLIHI